MKTIAVAAAVLLLAGAAFAGPASADSAPPPPGPPTWVVDFGTKFTTDYIIRSVTQSDGKPAIQGHAELILFDWMYAAIAGSSADYPALLYPGGSLSPGVPTGLSGATAEVDALGGVRHTWGAFTGDVGFLYHAFPGQIAPNTISPGFPSGNQNFLEVYVQPSYAINDMFTAGGSLWLSNNYGGMGAGSAYLAGNLKADLSKYSPIKQVGFSLSGEVGYQWLGETHSADIYAPSRALPSYAAWNVGAAFTYKAATLDLRYYGSTLSEGPTTFAGNFAPYGTCGVFSGLPNACGARFVASLSFDTSFAGK